MRKASDDSNSITPPVNVILRGLHSKFSAQCTELLVYSFDGFQTGEDIILYSSSPLNMPALGDSAAQHWILYFGHGILINTIKIIKSKYKNTIYNYPWF